MIPTEGPTPQATARARYQVWRQTRVERYTLARVCIRQTPADNWQHIRQRLGLPPAEGVLRRCVTQHHSMQMGWGWATTFSARESTVQPGLF